MSQLPPGAILTAVRIRSGKIINAAGRATGVHPSSVLRWERGETVPTQDLLLRHLQAPNASSDVQAMALVLARAGSNPFPVCGPDAEPPEIFVALDELFEFHIAAMELEARSIATEDPRWWDWLAIVQEKAIGGFLVKGSGAEAHAYALHVLRGHPGVARRPSLGPAAAVLLELLLGHEVVGQPH